MNFQESITNPGFFVELVIILLIIVVFIIFGSKRYINLYTIYKKLKEENRILNNIRNNDNIEIDSLIDQVDKACSEIFREENILLQRLKNIKYLISFPEKKIDHVALAETTFVREANRLDFLKSYANTAIMMGLFATIFGLGLSFLFMGEPSLKSLSNIIHNIIITFSATILGLLFAVLSNSFNLYFREKLTDFLANLEEYTAIKLIPLYETTETAKLDKIEKFIRGNLTDFLTNLKEYTTGELIPLYETTEAAKFNKIECLINALTNTASAFDKTTNNFSDWTININEFSKNFQKGVKIIKEKEEHLVIQYDDLLELYKKTKLNFQNAFENFGKEHTNIKTLIDSSEKRFTSTQDKLDIFSENITNSINNIAQSTKEEKGFLLKEFQRINDEDRLEKEALLKELQTLNSEHRLEKEALLKELQKTNSEHRLEEEALLKEIRKMIDEDRSGKDASLTELQKMNSEHRLELAKLSITIKEALLTELQKMNSEHRLELEKSSISLSKSFINNTNEIIEEYKKAHNEILDDYKNRRDQIEVHYSKEVFQAVSPIMDVINKSIKDLIQDNNKFHKERSDDMGRLIFDVGESMKGILGYWKEEIFNDIIETIKKLEFQNLIHALENIEISQREQIDVMKKFPKDDLLNDQLVNIQKHVGDIDYHLRQKIITFKELEDLINKLKDIIYEQSYKSKKFTN